MSSSDVWSRVVNEGIEDRVEVNQRMLIDKMLSRYSSDFVVFRELIQNSDDAQATSFELHFHCDSSRRDDLYEPLIKPIVSSHPKQNLLKGFLGQFLPQSLKSPSSQRDEDEFDHCLIDEIRCVNNGKVFDQDDWKRVQTIAEGNTNVESIGQFGVGFFSVFSYSERPLIESGRSRLAFVWKNGKALTTFKQEFNEEDSSNDLTTIILPMKEKYLLETKDLSSTIQEQSERKKRSTSRNTTTNEIVPTFNFSSLKRYLTKVLSFTKCLRSISINLNDRLLFSLNKRIESLSPSRLNFLLKRLNTKEEHSFFRLDEVKENEEIFQFNQNTSLQFHHFTIQTSIHIDEQFHQKIQSILKKDLPTTIQIEYLLSSSSSNTDGGILEEINPMEWRNDQFSPRGQIFIGLATQQTTGLGIHLFTHLIPTIERENIDLQDPYISIWNEQLLFSSGKILRLIYQQSILQSLHQSDQQENIEHNLKHLYTTFAFHRSAPNPQIGKSLSLSSSLYSSCLGEILQDGFCSMSDDLLVPVRRSPLDKHYSLIPSSEAFLSPWKALEDFLAIPLIPHSLSKENFFQMLKSRRWINLIDEQTLKEQIRQRIFSRKELICLLQWLSKNEMNNRSIIVELLSQLKYRSPSNDLLQLQSLKFYAKSQFSSLPLSSSVLPFDLVEHLTLDDLEQGLKLTSISFKDLTQFYLQQEQKHLFKDEKICPFILHFLSKHWNQFQDKEKQIIVDVLSTQPSIPTNLGIKLPCESYLPSLNLQENLPRIELHIPQLSLDKTTTTTNNGKEELLQNSVSLEFLQSVRLSNDSYSRGRRENIVVSPK